jgi:hypothetical protein
MANEPPAPVVKQVSIGIKQDQKADVRRTFMAEVGELWMGLNVRRFRKPWKRSKSWRVGPIKTKAKELWPPDGIPPEEMSDADVIEALKSVKGSDTSILRATGRRLDP